MKGCIFIILLEVGSCLSLAQSGSIAIISTKNGVSTVFKESVMIDPKEKTSKTRTDVGQRRNKLEFMKLSHLKSVIRSTFLPIGYPVKTPPGYLSFSIWSWIQDLSTQLRAILATQKVLEGVGVGRDGATALSATLNFILRDGCGSASTLLFTALKAEKFRVDVKKWRLFADIMNDIGITLEVVATLFRRELFLPMICVGNMFKAICGVAAGACNAKINLFWSKGSDISDINAKFGAQHTVTGSLGLVFAAIFAKYVSSIRSSSLLILYILLTTIHVYANIRCMRLVSFDYLNTDRLNAVCEGFLERIKLGESLGNILVETPKAISSTECLFFKPKFEKIKMGISFHDLVIKCKLKESQISKVVTSLQQNGYAAESCGERIGIVIAQDAKSWQKVKAYFHALLLQKLVETDEALEGKMVLNDTVTKIVEHLWPYLERSIVKSGWKIEETELATYGYEIRIENLVNCTLLH